MQIVLSLIGGFIVAILVLVVAAMIVSMVRASLTPEEGLRAFNESFSDQWENTEERIGKGD